MSKENKITVYGYENLIKALRKCDESTQENVIEELEEFY